MRVQDAAGQRIWQRLDEFAQGKTNGEIAAELVLSKRTVETHISNILSKLGLTSRAQIMLWAIDHKLT